MSATNRASTRLIETQGLLNLLMKALVRERGAIGTLDPAAILEITAEKTELSDQIGMLTDGVLSQEEAANSTNIELRGQVKELATSVHIAAQANAALLRDAQDAILALLGVSNNSATYDRRARSISRSVPMIGSSV